MGHSTSLTPEDARQIALLARCFKLASLYAVILALVKSILLLVGFHLIPGFLPPGGFRGPLGFEHLAVMLILGFGWVFVVVFSALLFYTGSCLSKRKAYRFCVVMSLLSGVMFPVGPLLTIFALRVLIRPTVKSGYDSPLPHPR